jgi:hypothetical protein
MVKIGKVSGEKLLRSVCFQRQTKFAGGLPHSLIGLASDVPVPCTGRLDVEDLLQTGFRHLFSKSGLRQGTPADVAETDEHYTYLLVFIH